MTRQAVLWRSTLVALTIAWGTGVTAPAALAVGPGDAPRYFSHPNYANSPLPTMSASVAFVGNPLVDRTYATDSAQGVPFPELADVLVVLQDAVLPTGMVQSFQALNQAAPGGSPTPSAGWPFHALILRPTGVVNQYEVVFESGELVVPPLADPAVSEVVTYPVPNIAVQEGDVLAFYGQGIPFDAAAGTDVFVYSAPVMPPVGWTFILNTGGFPIAQPNQTYSFGAQVLDLQNAVVDGGLRKFVDELPGLDRGGANDLEQYISLAVPDKNAYPGSDYYEIAVVEFLKQMHEDLPPTRLRGYVQLETPANAAVSAHYDLGNGYFAVDPPQYLGATIVAEKDRPVRVLFRNLLPTGEDGNLFIPVDTTVMGAGMTADGHMMEAMDPQRPMCGEPDKNMMVESGHCYAENRATLQLHGGISPWISDGTPHQWITPAGEMTPYPQGVSVIPVPDMTAHDSGDPDDGVMTFYYTNQQSARLMFYHDHSWGITRLNVYAGEAAGYLLRDATELSLLGRGLIPADEIPLVIQDKTFVPGMAQLLEQDETWDVARWGGEGNLWLPHVYVPAQNPGDASGVNDYGRWAYGPWFWPPTSNVDYGPVENPYFDSSCDPEEGWCEPPLMPGVPFNSMGMEAFMDTPVVNGTAYPTLTVEPKPYRFRVLNAANDRFFNLSLFKAVDANGVVCDAANTDPAPELSGVACTEVLLNPAEVAAALEDPFVEFPTPVPGNEGPDWIQIGTEGGFLPAPVVIPPHPTTWVNDPTVFNAGNVDLHSLLIAPAERADVIVDFSQYAGHTLILYNDAPAAFPARDPRYDYYTGNADLRDAGGTPPTLPGYGPNTRTVMQIKVVGEPDPVGFDLAALQAAFRHQPDGSGVFESGQNPIIVGQGAYNSAYGTTFQSFGPRAGLAQIYDTALTFDTLVGQLSMTFRPKMIQDEMGEAFEHEYGRMSGFLGVETPNAQAGLQNMILYPYLSPPTEVLDGVEVASIPTADGNRSLVVEPIASADDGTQIWKVTHNGVDTHPIHFHLYEVQLLNRVGWDGIIRKPDQNELGWKDTVRISPLEDTIVALRPVLPHMPFDLPNSVRLIDPSMHEGEYLANTTLQETLGLPIFAFNPDGEPVDVVNHYVNFGAEYVWHCHILSHEEMDMMHAQAVAVAPRAPELVSAVRVGTGSDQGYELTWTDNSANETDFVVYRRVAGSTGGWTLAATLPSSVLGVVPYVETGVGPGTGTRTYTDLTGNSTAYEYQVFARNVVGDTWDYSNPAFNEIPPGGGFPTVTVFSNGTTTPPRFPIASLSPASLTFGVQLVGSASATQAVTLENTGNDELLISAITLGGEDPGDFALADGCGASLAAGTTCTIGVSFVPVAAGERTAVLTVASNDAANPTLSVALAGTGTAVSITPLGPLTFANQLVGTKSAPKTIVFQNFGPTPVSMSRTITGNTADFVTTGCTATSLSPGQRCTVTIWFQPRAAGTRTISVAFTYGDPASPTTIVASGFATAPVATLSPTLLELRTPYQVPTERDLTITNTGTAPLTLNSITLGGTSASQFAIVGDTCGAPRTLAPTQACVVTVRFLAQTTTTASATLNVGFAAPAASRSVTLIGYIIRPTYIIAPRPPTFPDTTVGSTRAVTTWVQNIGTLPLTINGFSFSGSTPGSFSETDGCPATLPAGAACAVTVTFAPATAGAHSATMTLDAGAPAASLSVPLAGNGVEALAAQ